MKKQVEFYRKVSFLVFVKNKNDDWNPWIVREFQIDLEWVKIQNKSFKTI